MKGTNPSTTVDTPISKERDDGISFINSLDFTKIKAKLMKEHKWTQQQADIAEKWYKRFLVLRFLHPGKPLVPTMMIDEVWHAHILDTRRYAEDCQNMFGRFMHHAPNYGGEKDLSVSENETNKLFLMEFGENPTDMMAICQDESGDLLEPTLQVCEHIHEDKEKESDLFGPPEKASRVEQATCGTGCMSADGHTETNLVAQATCGTGCMSAD